MEQLNIFFGTVMIFLTVLIFVLINYLNKFKI